MLMWIQTTHPMFSSISLNERVFNESIEPYQKALELAGHKFKLKYQEPEEEKQKPKNKATIRK